MKKLTPFIIFLFASVCLHAQGDTAKSTSVKDDDPPVTYSDQPPQFPGGDQELNKYLADNITYPTYEKRNRIEGNVFVNFTVERDGSISDVHIVKGVPGAPGFDSVVIAVVQAMPKWTPGRQNGKAVRVSYTIPIRFTMGDNQPANDDKKKGSRDKRRK